MERNPWKKLLQSVKLVANRNGGYGREFTTERAKAPKRIVKISWQDLEHQYIRQNKRCFWTGQLLDMEAVFRTYYVLTPSVDRYDNSRGYEIGNFVITTRFMNLARGNTPPDEFRKIIEAMFENSPILIESGNDR